MKTRIIYLCLLVIFSTTGCISKNARKGINGNKNIVTRTIQVDDFEEIHLGSNIESAKSINPFNKKNRAICNYTQTDGASSLEISMDENLFDLLDIENKDHKLIIKAKSGKKICPTHLVLNTSSKNLKEAGISGSIDFIADQPLQLTNTSFYISGVGDVKLADLSCDTFKVAISGVGNIYLNGNIKKGKYSVSGVGHVYAFDCPVEDLECEVSGVGGMEVNATQKLDASTSGVGSVKYKGNPEHTQKSASGGGKINIGYIFPLAGHYIPHNVRTFLDQEENKNVAFSFWQNHTPAIAQKVKSGELDLGFGGFLKRDDMEFFPLIQQPLVIVSPEQHPIADEPEVPLVKLTRYPVIGYDRASWMGAYTGHLYRKYQLHPNIIMECPDEYSIVALVRENFGIALMPRTDILEQADGIRIHTLKGLEIYHQTFMFWMKNRYRLPAVERFTEYMKQHADIIEESRNDSENVSKVYLKDIVNF